jgi:RNAse (barnase) inhibitor barstar
MEGKWPKGESEGSDKLAPSILKWWYVGPDGLPQLEIDGNNFTTLEEFVADFNRNVFGNDLWTGHLDQLDDMLGGDFGTPEGGFVLCWKNHDISRYRLGLVFDSIVETIDGNWRNKENPVHRMLL